ncbi:MAG TPA: hypothetical protein VGI64_03030 [Streptosporangiaceae bacterium]
MEIVVRPARPGDVAVLAEVRLANARRHVEPDPAGHRLPDAGTVRAYFRNVLGQRTSAPSRSTPRQATPSADCC